MKSTEQKHIREEMGDMHQFFIEKIENAINDGRYIEASWLIYSCMENRFFRVLQKYKKQCKYCKGKCQKNRNELAISTKIECVRWLCEADVTCISNSFEIDLLKEIKKWIKNRNNMMHNLLSLDSYKNCDDDFKQSALSGQILLKKLYDSCTNFRREFYADDYEFIFPEGAMEGCHCKNTNDSKEK